MQTIIPDLCPDDDVHLAGSFAQYFACGLYVHEPHLCSRTLGAQMRTLRPSRRLLLPRLESVSAVLPVQHPDGATIWMPQDADAVLHLRMFLLLAGNYIPVVPNGLENISSIILW